MLELVLLVVGIAGLMLLAVFPKVVREIVETGEYDPPWWELAGLQPAVLENDGGIILAHRSDACVGDVCPLHRRTEHGMRGWPQLWRGDAAKMERTCPHGVGHPDPDHLASLSARGLHEQAAVDGVHGCDGCCHECEEDD